MGDRTSLTREDRGDTALLLYASSVPRPCIDMGDPGNSGTAPGRIEIGIEDAAATRELELGALAFADLDARRAKTGDQLIGIQTDEIALLRPAFRPGRADRRAGGRSTGSEKKGSGWEKFTH